MQLKVLYVLEWVTGLNNKVTDYYLSVLFATFTTLNEGKHWCVSQSQLTITLLQNY